jgi:4-amino-4-deoxy-L-arabinose transferase-like glycosyltransferase
MLFKWNLKIVNKLILILILIIFVLLGIKGINYTTDPQAWDTTAYLGEANFIKNNGGVINFLELCTTGKYKQSNQHPLYILLLTPFASTNISFFILAKIISFLIGLVFLLLLYFFSKRLVGETSALLLLLIFIFNTLFIKWTTLVAAESLLILFSFLSMYFIIVGFIENKKWIYAGIFASLAYLTKGTSLILLPGFILVTFIIYRFKIFTNKYFWSFFVLFIIISSPLLIRNTVVYQNPFFNVNNYIVTYGIDYLEEYRYVTFSNDEGATLWKFDHPETGDVQSQVNVDPSPNSSNSVIIILSGIGLSFKLFWHSFNIFGQHFPGIISTFAGIITAIFFVFGLMRYKNKGGNYYFITTIFVFILVFSFNPIDRYFFPLIPFFWIYVLVGMRDAKMLLSESRIKKYLGKNYLAYIPYTLLIFTFIYSIYLVVTKPLSNPLNSVEYDESRKEILNWLRKNVKENEKYTLGPNLNWQLEKGIWILPPDNAKLRSFSKFNSFMEKHDVSYVIIDHHSLHDKMLVNEGIFSYDENQGIVENKKIENWDLVYEDHNVPTKFLIYKIHHKAN